MKPQIDAKRAKPTPSGTASTAIKASPIDRKWQWHYRTLVALRERLAAEGRQIARDVAEPIEAHGRHIADSATDEFEHDVSMLLLARDGAASRDIGDGIARILNGKYGVCEESGREIPAERLRAIPWCRYTREIEARLEQARGGLRARLPEAVSLRGSGHDIPETGSVTHAHSEGPPEDPPENTADKIRGRIIRPDRGPGR